MSGRFVRASHYRHVFGTAAKPEHEYAEVKPLCTGEGNYIACNDKFFCYATAGGGGPVVVWPLTKFGRLPHNVPTIQVHKDAVLDFEFNPFVGNVLATGSEDCTAKVSSVPWEGLKENVTENMASLEGHERKVSTVHWHPTASDVLATCSHDMTVRVWDTTRSAQIAKFDDFQDVIHSFDWNPDGSLIAASSKDLNLRVFDPRAPSSAALKTATFTGSKTSRALWAGSSGRVLAVGASKTSSRQYALWDTKKFDQPLTQVDIDSAAGVLIPYFDPDNGILYLAGKGDGNIRYLEVNDNDPYVHFLSEFRDNQSQKGAAWMPKRTCDTTKTEIAVCMRMLRDRVTPISFQVPRKSDQFQKDLYPDAYSGLPEATVDDYIAGKNAAPAKQSMKPGEAPKLDATHRGSNATKPPPKSAAQLERELTDAHNKIAQLEAELAKLKAQ